MPCYMHSAHSGDCWGGGNATVTSDEVVIKLDRRDDLEVAEAVLCRIITVLGPDRFAAQFASEWDNAGVTPVQLARWWKHHQQRDRAKKRAEALAAKRAEKDKE
jgi:hypothetical protein